MSTLLRGFLFLLCVGLASQATASSEAGRETSTTLQKVGEARLEVLFWSIYDSRLFTADGTYSEGKRPLRLEVEYLRDIKAERLVKRTVSEWQAMGRNHPQQAEWAQQLNRLWRDIRAGDVLTLELDREDRATFLLNGAVLGQIEDPEFGQQFADIWLSEESTRPKLRQALLGRDN